MQPIGHDSTAGVEGGSGSGRGHGCCFETLTPPLTGRKQSHHETESSNLLSPKSFGLVITLALRHFLLALFWLTHSANHSPHTPLAPSLDSTKHPHPIISTNRPTIDISPYEPRFTLYLKYLYLRLYISNVFQRLSGI
jgi:hypothetical protein